MNEIVTEAAEATAGVTRKQVHESKLSKSMNRKLGKLASQVM